MLEHIGISKQYIYNIYKKLFLLFVLFLLLITLFFLDIWIGYYEIHFLDIVNFFFAPQNLDPLYITILMDFRIPTALMAILVGLMLGLAGSQMQTLLRNPLADPFTLGISSAASFGAGLAIISPLQIPFLSEFLISGHAFFFGFSTCLFIYFVAYFKGLSNQVITLLGIALFFSFNALSSILKYLSNEFEIQSIVFWSMGSFIASSWVKIIITAIIFSISFSFFMFYRHQLTLLSFGDDSARNLGISIKLLKLQSLFFISLLASTAVAFVGIIGFIGLASPHIARFILGEDHRFFIPSASIMGGILLSISSIISKIIVPGVIIPIGIISALIGVPVFMYLIFNQKKEEFFL